MSSSHEKVEKNIGVMIVLIALVISLGGLAQIIPLMFQAEAIDISSDIEVLETMMAKDGLVEKISLAGGRR